MNGCNFFFIVHFGIAGVSTEEKLQILLEHWVFNERQIPCSVSQVTHELLKRKTFREAEGKRKETFPLSFAFR